MGKDINFNHWKYSEYGDSRTHYTKHKIQPKQERTEILMDIVMECVTESVILDRVQFIKICEFGCNNGRNLMPFYDIGMDVYGYDICALALDAARDSMNRCSANFKNIDLFNQHSELSSVSDDYYDFSFTMGFLMHLPKSQNKNSLIKEIIRVSKNVLIYELFRPGGIEESYPEDGWYLSEMDYNECDSRFNQLHTAHVMHGNRHMKVWLLEKNVQ